MRVALVRPDRIGDCVIGSCAIRDLRRTLPDTEIAWVVRSSNAGLFAGADFPAKLIAYDEADGVDALAARLKAFAADVVVLMSPDRFADEAALRSGVPVRIGFDSEIAGALTVRPGCDKARGEKHEADYARELLALIPGVTRIHDAPASPCLAPDGDSRWREMLPPDLVAKGFFIIHPGAHPGKASVPVSVWAEAAEKLRAKTGYVPVLVGASADGLWPDSGAADLRGRLSLAGTADLLKHAQLCLSRDSGPAHLAAAVGCPTVCVFLENTPKMGPVRWTPLGSAVRTIVPPPPRGYEKLFFGPYRRRAVASVRADAIVDAALALLRAR